MHVIPACSVSRSVQERLRRLPSDESPGHVLSAFGKVCNLVSADQGVLTLVIPEIGNGPLNVVVDGPPGLLAQVEPSTPAAMGKTQIRIGELQIDLRKAETWEPCPDWETLRGQRAVIASQAAFLRALCLRYAPSGSLLGLLGAMPTAREPTRSIFLSAKRAAETLIEGCRGDSAQLHEGATRLAGLGNGLTPAGDDFLTGVMVWIWLNHPAPESLCRRMADASESRTTTLSAALLRASARGENSAAWHALLKALAEGPSSTQKTRLSAAVQGVLSVGATSGADSLAGFLYSASALGGSKASGSTSSI
jgi:hypothetical protein